MNEAKPFCISKHAVWEAYKRVKANQGAAGVDGQSISQFEESLKSNLYKLWNRMSSGRPDRQQELTPEERDAYLALGEDLQRVWSHERTPPQLRKRLLRAVLVEIIATIKGLEIHLLLHWKGGDHSHLVVPRNRTGEHRWTRGLLDDPWLPG